MAQAVVARAKYSKTFFRRKKMETRKEQLKWKLAILLIAAAVAACAPVATAEVSYHLVVIPDIGGATAITDSGVILAGSVVVEPARAAGNPVWDSDGDGIANGYTITTLDPGEYVSAGGRSINNSLDVVGSGTDGNGDRVALLWWNAPEGRTLVELGRSFTDAEILTFPDGVEIVAASINDLGQVLVGEFGGNFSGPVEDWTLTDVWALLNPKDTDGDGAPDLWFEDLDGDGANDLMVELQYGTRWGGLWGPNAGCINNLGVVAAIWNPTNHGFVVLPMDTDGDGEPDLWFEDVDGDGWNDLATDLGPLNRTIALSDSGLVVGFDAGSGNDDYYFRWQIDESGNVELVAEEQGATFINGVNNLGQAVGAYRKYLPHDRIDSTTILWEPDLTIIDLLGLLDNRSRSADSLRGSDINNTGYIVGTVLDDYYQYTPAFVAVPISQNAPPEVSISSPLDGATFDSGATINFSGTASDPEDGDLTSSMVWTSNIDGQIGTGGSFSTTLSDGIHTITASVTDSSGASSSDSVNITVGTPPVPVGPSVDSIEPSSLPRNTTQTVTIGGSGFVDGAEVTFENGSGPSPSANVTSVGGTTIEALVTVHKKAKLGVSWDVRVTNPDGSSDALVEGFTVTQ
jgi:hypothetical protein